MKLELKRGRAKRGWKWKKKRRLIEETGCYFESLYEEYWTGRVFWI